MSVLPRKAYLELCATGECIVEGKIHSYTLSRTRKTIVTSKAIKDQRWIACIVFTDNEKPLQDRLVMEYLLIRSDEERYLKTAILTPIGPPPSSGAALAAQAAEWDRLNALNYPVLYYNPLPQLPEEYRRGDTVQYRRPPQYRRPIHAQDITDNALLHIKRWPDVAGLRWHMLGETFYITERHRVERLTQIPGIQQTDLHLQVDDFVQRFIAPPARQLAADLVQHPELNTIVELPLPGGMDMFARTRCMDTGLSVRYLRGFDITQNLFLDELGIGAMAQ